MPVNGLISNRDELEFYVSSAGSGSHTGSGSGVYGHGATITANTTPDVLTFADGFSLVVGGNSATNLWSVTYTGPGAPLGVTYSGAGWSSVDAKVVVEGEKLYNSVFWKLQGTLKVYAQGVLRLTVSLDENSGGMGPAYVPIYGVPIELQGSASASATGVSGTTYSYSTECTGTQTAGWRFKEAGSVSWVDLPVTLAPGSAASVAGTCTDPGVATVSASDTYVATITSYARSDGSRSLQASGSITECILRVFCDGVEVFTDTETQVPPVPWETYEVSAETWARAGSIRLIPNLDKAVKRFSTDYGALWYRAEFPKTQRISAASCTINGVTTSTSTITEVHPEQSAILQRVTSSTAAMEDTLGYDSYAPWSTSGNYTKSLTYETTPLVVSCPSVPIGLCEEGVLTVEYEYTGGPNPPPAYSQNSSRSYQFPYTVSTNIVGYLSHANAMARYFNSWCNPHWSYFLWREDWELEGSPAPFDQYWGPIGSQWHENTALPGGERTKQRNHIVADCLREDGMTPFLDTFVSGFPWIGVSRWQTDEVTPLTSVVMDSDSSPAWSAPDEDYPTSLSFGAGGITLSKDPLGAGVAATLKVRLDLGRFTEKPYFYPHIAAKVLLNWVTTNVSAVRAYWVSATLTRTLIELTPGDGFTTRNQQYDKPREADSKYAGSWGQDFGAGYTPDAGTDALPTGNSSGAMGDVERNLALGLLQGAVPAYLEFEFDIADDSQTVELEYPEWFLPAGDWTLYWETRQVCDIVWEDGPGIRWGQWVWYSPGGGLQNPPFLSGLGYKSTIIDWLCARRILFQNVAHNGGSPDLTTQLTQLFDTYEGQSVGQVDRNSISFILPKGVASSGPTSAESLARGTGKL